MTPHVPSLPFARRRRLLVFPMLVVVGAAAAAGVIAARSPAGVYTWVPWTRGQATQMRYCQHPDNAGAFLAASAGVTCQAAGAVERALTSRCYARGRCGVESFRCVTYYDGRYGGTFAVYHHALCSARHVGDQARRVVWDGG